MLFLHKGHKAPKSTNKNVYLPVWLYLGNSYTSIQNPLFVWLSKILSDNSNTNHTRIAKKIGEPLDALNFLFRNPRLVSRGCRLKLFKMADMVCVNPPKVNLRVKTQIINPAFRYFGTSKSNTQDNTFLSLEKCEPCVFTISACNIIIHERISKILYFFWQELQYQSGILVFLTRSNP